MSKLTVPPAQSTVHAKNIWASRGAKAALAVALLVGVLLVMVLVVHLGGVGHVMAGHRGNVWVGD